MHTTTAVSQSSDVNRRNQDKDFRNFTGKDKDQDFSVMDSDFNVKDQDSNRIRTVESI